MFENLFKGVFDAEWMTSVSVGSFLQCVGFALLLGAIIALCYMYKSICSKSFTITLALLPSVVCALIMLVNGNIGTGVAVAGAFSLVRFRSTAGTAKEICMVFFAMSAGLISGMGYLGLALIFTLVLCLMFTIYNSLDFGMNNRGIFKTVRIMIAEDLDYTGVFDDIFNEYLKSYELTNVKTTNMGSMFKLTYDVVLKDVSKEKEMIDMLRCRNGNLEISVSKTAQATDL